MNRYVQISHNRMPHPPRAYVVNFLDAPHLHRQRFNLIDDLRLNGVYKPPPDSPGGIRCYQQDRSSYQQPDKRINDSIAKPRACSANHNRQAGKAVNP